VRLSDCWLTLPASQFQPIGGRSGCVHLRNYSAAYREWGEGPPVVLIPGLAGGIDLLAPLAQKLSRDFRVIAYQLRGEDDPFALRRRFGIRQLVDDLEEFLDQHSLETPTLLGVSFGGIVALEFAIRFPGRLNRLIVQGVGARSERGLVHRLAGAVLSGFPLPDDNAFVNQFFKLLFGCRQPAESLFAYATRQCWRTDQGIMAHRFALVERFDVTGRLLRIGVPSLILAGDRDLLVSPNSLRQLREGMAGHRFVGIKGSGHLACLSHSEAMAAAVRDFLA
jgi:pimeloyl-ACP methyl ester carboxylesterase